MRAYHDKYPIDPSQVALPPFASTMQQNADPDGLLAMEQAAHPKLLPTEVAEEAVPAGQLLQDDEPSVSEYVPAGHTVAVSPSPFANDPIGTGWHEPSTGSMYSLGKHCVTQYTDDGSPGTVLRYKPTGLQDQRK